ncbi:hypothetical protein RJ492_001204 [Pluralibacter gergoviae]|uniref:Uncharacterized protein n=1 Tax=Pluralibacter gergoviae TaxID=61647 RepID=A0AAI9GP37_PLUGE|nr:hypothetical protein [Pluralibacter gergoviae]EKV9907713.1 hypothetical protein [Pluralibacter gergoviae]EKW7276818.1 hypothetical protein [Pluralibacter gergoviae]ELD4293955.1 hypothetical protein [Pluralibacter gergoviae]ELD4304734.1 hypothetical protein [Pluralibacter gergoviae]
MRNITVEVLDVEYTGTTAPAKDQVEMLQIAAQAGLMPVISPEVGDFAIMTAVAGTSAGATARLAELCLNNGKFKRADGVPVAENLFQDKAHGYLLLIGKVLRENIGPFWSLNSDAKSPAGETVTPQ